MDWGDHTVVLDGTGRTEALPRGRGLGGSSAINAMAFMRGPSRRATTRGSTAGAKGWGFDDLLPYFKRSEHAEGRDPAVRGSAARCGRGTAHPPHPLVGGRDGGGPAELGHPIALTTSTAAWRRGSAGPSMTIVDGRRQSAADAYLLPVLDRPNLDVVTDALVHRLLFSGDRCTGVEYSVGGDTVTAECAGEVVLTAGAIGIGAAADALRDRSAGPPA